LNKEDRTTSEEFNGRFGIDGRIVFTAGRTHHLATVLGVK
jgi:hypothetical protein